MALIDSKQLNPRLTGSFTLSGSLTGTGIIPPEAIDGQLGIFASTGSIQSTANDLVIKPIFSFTSSKSRAASKTIKIKPTTPKTCNNGNKFGFCTPKRLRPKLISIPKKININTAGTPDRLASRLKK